MLRKLFKLLHHREALWLAPFLCIALIALSLLRPLPHFPLPASYRSVVDKGGTTVHIALPFRGIALTSNSFASTYLEDTRSPELLVFAGKPGDRKWFSLGVMSWVYPEVLKKDSLWSTKLFRNTDSPYTEIETLFAYDHSVWVGCGGPPDLVKRIGLPVFNCSGSQTLRKQISLPNLKSKVGCGSPPDTMRNKYSKSYLQGGYYSENYLFPELRSYLAFIGNSKLAEIRIDAYCQQITDLQRELQPSDLVTRPRALAEGEDRGNLPRAGIVDAETDRKIPGDDAERLLVMDPDIIFLAVGSPKEYMSEARWQGLKAVRDRRVYRRPGLYEWWATGMTFKPIEVRWMAEVAHPDRLQPKVRQLLGERVMSEFGYRLSEDQIDQIFHVADNAGSVGAERFTRNYQTTNNQRLSK